MVQKASRKKGICIPRLHYNYNKVIDEMQIILTRLYIVLSVVQNAAQSGDELVLN